MSVSSFNLNLMVARLPRVSFMICFMVVRLLARTHSMMAMDRAGMSAKVSAFSSP